MNEDEVKKQKAAKQKEWYQKNKEACLKKQKDKRLREKEELAELRAKVKELETAEARASEARALEAEKKRFHSEARASEALEAEQKRFHSYLMKRNEVIRTREASLWERRYTLEYQSKLLDQKFELLRAEEERTLKMNIDGCRECFSTHSVKLPDFFNSKICHLISDECPVCYGSTNNNLVVNSCGHTICSSCYSQIKQLPIKQQKCPECRKQYFE
tara:strand:- start:724 stop:1371 length:648 start_codon:yes stop_codon:yes gene_type:complete